MVQCKDVRGGISLKSEYRFHFRFRSVLFFDCQLNYSRLNKPNVKQQNLKTFVVNFRWIFKHFLARHNTQYTDTQRNDTQHNDTQHNDKSQ
jgi:hypothetical protein